jgi:fructokinase
MNFNVVGVGEILWDLLPTGPQLGGAPANFAYHAHALGAQAQVISRVGADDQGREIIRRFNQMGLPDAGVQIDPSNPTGTAQVEVSSDGLAHFTIQESVAWDHIALTSEALAIANAADAICFGTLAQRSYPSRHTIQQLIATTPADALKVFDINLRQQFYSRDVIEESLRQANVLKLNDDELPVLAEVLNPPSSTVSRSCGADTPVRVLAAKTPSARTKPSAESKAEPQIEHQIEALAHTFNLRVVALTRGAKGSLLYQSLGENQRWSNCESRSVEVVDTVGAGDAFTAALVMGLLVKMDLNEINSIANEVARYVCSQPGATPPLPPELAEKLANPVRP